MRADRKRRGTTKAVMQLCLPVTTKTDGKWRVASIPTLDLHAQGRSKREALSNLMATAHDFFVSCIERRTLDDVLCEAGLMPLADAFPRKVPPTHDGKEHITVRVPLVSVSNTDHSHSAL